MPTPEKLKAPFCPGSFYHIVFKSIDGIFLFYNDYDYKVYLERFKKFIADFADTWSFSLLNNHTHYICKVRSAASINLFINQLPDKEKTTSMLQWMNDPVDNRLFDAMLERQMNRFLVSYANYLNNKYERKGSVFQSPFRRIEITEAAYLQQAIIYVNANAQKHGLVNDYKNYLYSSFNNIIRNDTYYIDTQKVIGFFNGKEQLIKTHEDQVAFFYNKGWPSSKLE